MLIKQFYVLPSPSGGLSEGGSGDYQAVPRRWSDAPTATARAKLTELGLHCEAVNVAASGEGRAEVRRLTEYNAVPVLADGEEVIVDLDGTASCLEENYRADPKELRLDRPDPVAHRLQLTLPESRRDRREAARGTDRG